jgi:hypothetical protein
MDSLNKQPTHDDEGRPYPKPPFFGWIWEQLKNLSLFIVAVLALLVFVDWQKQEAIEEFRSEINGAATAICEANQKDPFAPKYNTLLDLLTWDLQKRQADNVAKGDTAKAEINGETLVGLSKIRIQVKEVDCNKPLLPNS